MASFVINELKQVGIEATLKQIETAQWHPMATRGDYQIGANLTGLGIDDPDANFYENYACGSPAQLQPVLQRAGGEDDRPAVAGAEPEEAAGHGSALQKKLEEEAPRPILDWRLDYFAHWPYVQNMVPHNNIYNFGRMQDVWRDK